jgi:hypothetical protein
MNEPWLRVFEHRLLREVFGPKREGVKGDGRILYNEEGDSWFWPPSDTILGIKSRTVNWLGMWHIIITNCN